MLHLYQLLWLHTRRWRSRWVRHRGNSNLRHDEVHRQRGEPKIDKATISTDSTEIYTVGTGVAIGQACMLLSAGDKGKRYMTPHATAMLHQPKVPSTGERQATELQIKWKEVKAQKQVMIDILSKNTGHNPAKIEKVSFTTPTTSSN